MLFLARLDLPELSGAVAKLGAVPMLEPLGIVVSSGVHQGSSLFLEARLDGSVLLKL